MIDPTKDNLPDDPHDDDPYSGLNYIFPWGRDDDDKPLISLRDVAGALVVMLLAIVAAATGAFFLIREVVLWLAELDLNAVRKFFAEDWQIFALVGVVVLGGGLYVWRRKRRVWYGRVEVGPLGASSATPTGWRGRTTWSRG